MIPVEFAGRWISLLLKREAGDVQYHGINQRLDLLLAWLSRSSPDITCLQELKARDNRFSLKAILDAGYGAIWRFWCIDGIRGIGVFEQRL
jgi:exonuclease III